MVDLLGRKSLEQFFLSFQKWKSQQSYIFEKYLIMWKNGPDITLHNSTILKYVQCSPNLVNHVF
jgi:hypothetical protein